MKLEVSGVEYTDFTSLNATLHLDALANVFTFEAAAPNVSQLPFKGGELARVTVDGEPILTGYIEIVGGGYDSQGHGITYQGRDRTGDFLDSMIDTIGDLGQTISLKSVIEKVISSIGINIFVIDNANPKKFNPAQDIEAPEPGDNAFDFVESLARQRQVLLTSNSDGDIVIEKVPDGDSNGTLQNIRGAANNNIISADFTFDQTKRFRVYKFASSLNPITLNKTNKTSISTIVGQKGSVIDTDIRIGRQFVDIPESTFGSEDNGDRALWEANIRKARGRIYSCTIQGYTPGPDFDIWRPNRLVTIVDEFADIDAKMLINTVDFSLDPQNGRLTTLTLIDQNAYTLELEDPTVQELGNQLF